MRKPSYFAAIPLMLILAGCFARTKADLLIYNAKIYTVDSSFSVADAMVIGQGKILAVGKKDELSNRYDPQDQEDLQGKFVYPGFIDAHTHFYRYALGLETANLFGTESWEDILNLLAAFSREHSEGWLIGRGWDQNDWNEKQFPTNEKLNELFPDRPVFLVRVDGHAAIANKAALELAGLKPGVTIEGGEILSEGNQLTGLLIDNAVDMVSKYQPVPDAVYTSKMLDIAQQNCFAVGLTTVDDCGLDASEILFMDSLQKTGLLKMRVYAMLSDNTDNFVYAMARGPLKTERMNVRSFKLYADGALGSRGACLLRDYTDRPGWKGFLLQNESHFDSVTHWLYNHEFQACTHAIGDSGNRTLLNIYAKYLAPGNDLRWRIEHAQIVDPADVVSFGKYNIIPSVQPTHATSDMYWAGDRLGAERLKTAYAFKDLMNQNGWIPLGTDFPVEDISPFKTFYAAVVRKDAKGFPAAGFQMENALSREQALRGMTIWAAKSNFEETEKGSLEIGKWADFTITDQDLMTTAPENLLRTAVLRTYLNGERVYMAK